jgi:hypothetical protein
LVSHIYGCGRIYLKNGFDWGGELLFVEGMDLGTGNSGDELLNF